MAEQEHPNVFISYSHDSAEHADRVLALADALRASGIDVVLDRFVHPAPVEGWTRWMDNHIDAADFVVLVCTEVYRRRVMGQGKAGEGLGVRWEGKLVFNRIYNDEASGSRFIPVLLPGATRAHIPNPLQDHTCYRITTADFSDAGFEGLLRHLTGQPLTPPSDVGPIPRLPPKARASNKQGPATPSDGGSAGSRSASRTLADNVLVWSGALCLMAATAGGALKLLSGVSAGTKGTTELPSLTGPIFWAVLFALMSLGVWLVYLGSRKRSQLLRPEVLALRTDDPAHLRGRIKDLEKLADLCRNRPLVFLVGESGAGKSALVRAGLCGDESLLSSVVPVLVDGWGDDWSDGPTRRLTEALRASRALSEDERAKLQLAPGAPLADVLAAVELIATEFGRTPLLIFDQFDDYQTRHRTKFRNQKTGTWKTTAQITAHNPFWKGIATLIRAERAHALIVTPSDAAAGLFAVQFVPEPEPYPLDRPSASVVKPLLDDLTRADLPGGAVVADPENGWKQLKERLARNLEEDGSVLPIRLRTALAGLSALPRLTLPAYQRAGGLRGLEARAVETLVAGAARHSALERGGVIGMLKIMVHAGQPLKTVAKPITELRTIAQGNPVAVDKALEFLEKNELVRRIPSSGHGDISWQLDHDYWSNAVLEVEKRSDYWNVRLRDAHRAWEETHGNLRNWWRALLSPPQQAVLLWQRLRGRCRFGAARGYWCISTVRMAPYLTIIAVGWFLAALYLDQRDEVQARTWFSMIGRTNEAGDDEMKECFWPLALERREGVRWHFLRVGLETPDNAERLGRRADLAAQSAVGLDARFRSRIVDKLLLQKLSERVLDAKIVFACAAVGRALHAADDHEAFVASISQALARALKDETDQGRFVGLAGAFAEAAKRVKPEQAEPVAQWLVQAVEHEADPRRLEWLANAFVVVAAGAKPEQQAAVAQRLAQAVAEADDPNRLARLASAFVVVAKGATPEQQEAVAQRLAHALTQKADPYQLDGLANPFAAVVNGAKPEQQKAWVQWLVQAVTTETDPGRLARLADTFVAVAKDAMPEQQEAVVRRLVQAVKAETHPGRLRALADTFVAVAKDAVPEQQEAVVRRLVQAVKAETDPDRLRALADTFVAVAKGTAPEQQEAVAQRLAQAVEEEADPNRLIRLGNAFVAVAKGAKPKQQKAVAQRLAQALTQPAGPNWFHGLASTFAAVANGAKPEQQQAAAQRLAQAVTQENDPDRIATLANAFVAVAKGAKPEQQEAVAQRLLQAVNEENDPVRLAALATDFMAVAKDPKPEQREAVAQRLLRAVTQENDPDRIARLADALAAVANGAKPEQQEVVVQRLLQAVNEESDTYRLARLADTFIAVAKDPKPEQQEAVAQRLLQAVKQEADPQRLVTLALAFAAVAKGTKPEQSGSFFRNFAVAMQTKGNSSVISTWAEIIAELPGPLDPSDLANVLKYPNCTGEVRSAVLGRLAKVLQIPWQPTDSPWRIITHAKLNSYVYRPLVAPPDWPTK